MSGKARTTHGMHALMARMHSQRLDRRTRRTLASIQHGLTAQPLEQLHALVVGHLTRWELVLQGHEAHAIANPSEPLPRSALGVINAWRRTAELLAALEQQIAERDRSGGTTPLCARCGQRFGDSMAYLHHSRTCPGASTPAASPSSAAIAAAAVNPVAPDAAAAPPTLTNQTPPTPVEPGNQQEDA